MSLKLVNWLSYRQKSCQRCRVYKCTTGDNTGVSARVNTGEWRRSDRKVGKDLFSVRTRSESYKRKGRVNGCLDRGEGKLGTEFPGKDWTKGITFKIGIRVGDITWGDDNVINKGSWLSEDSAMCYINKWYEWLRETGMVRYIRCVFIPTDKTSDNLWVLDLVTDHLSSISFL